MRVLGLYIALITIFSGVILAIRLIGGTQPNPIAVLFTNPDSTACQMPCLLGVHPGKTRLDEALQILDQHPLTHGMNIKRDGKSAILYSREASIELSVDGSHLVDQIRLGSHQSDDKLIHTPQLAWIMRQANPGNQTLYFGRIGDGLGRGSRPPYILTYCYYDRHVCFETVSWEDGLLWQDEDFNILTIYNKRDEAVP